MTIQNVSSTLTTSSYNSPQQHKFIPLLTANMAKNEQLTPEQKNTLQDDADAKLTEQAENIKSTYQTAKDMDLTHAYYQQQQKLVDIYMQSNTAGAVSSNQVNHNAVQTLTDTYVAIYNIHQKIKKVGQQHPTIPDDNLPLIAPITTLPLEGSHILSNAQTDSYNNLMMPTTKSYLHLSA